MTILVDQQYLNGMNSAVNSIFILMCERNVFTHGNSKSIFTPNKMNDTNDQMSCEIILEYNLALKCRDLSSSYNGQSYVF